MVDVRSSLMRQMDVAPYAVDGDTEWRLSIQVRLALQIPRLFQ